MDLQKFGVKLFFNTNVNFDSKDFIPVFHHWIQDKIVSQFKEYFYDTKIFFDRFAKGKFGKYLLHRNENPPKDLNNDLVHRKIEESQLFLEAAHACYARLRDVETKENRG